MENQKEIIIFGCGNWLFGDDGFGPEVVRYLKEKYQIPENVEVIDAGTGVRNLLFDILLSERKPRKVLIVDAVDAGKNPGDIFEIDVSQIPLNKIDDFSMHQLPTSNLLKELKEFCGIDVKILCAQVESVPQEVQPGLSEKLKESVKKICEEIIKELKNG